MHYWRHCIAIASGILIGGHVMATPTPEEAKQLGTTLTPVGAEKAGNKDGTIPAWDGGICTPPAGYKPKMGAAAGGAPYVDPFANEKPLYRITAANLSQYGDKVDAGTKELFKRYPNTYVMDVYPSHRTACMPKWVYENTAKRIMNPKLIGSAPGITGAHAQIPFPIPKNGYEVMWNMVLKWEPTNFRFGLDAGLMDASGTFTRASYQIADTQNLYWDNTLTTVPEDRPYRNLLAWSKEPASQAGLAQLRTTYLRQDLHEDVAWSYVPGQRRVRRAPEFTYDTVSTTSGGLLIFDEINGWDGRMDKYDFKLVGKKEVYLPYNNYKALAAPIEEAMAKDHENPAVMRWELHRVWMVEGTLKPGERHIQQKKVFLIDEDSWMSPVYYALDHSGKVHHLMHLPLIQEYEKPGPRTLGFILYDMSRGIYGFQTKPQGRPDQYGVITIDKFPQNRFLPDALAGAGVR
ncbi:MULTISPECIES: DUF1329 domain-containing protein [Pandoraea]|uniref:DUF1329 domain-containing protein n=1 Tax=Pandoraea cepalis TaxID=2508294 RepID=A0AAW7MH67_9BURK|nr:MULTISPECIES: DUF1329 domain-containing protein [Pandoraea]ALS65148.1 hypothetical protein AT395_09235 [Pandoraea apista]MDN4572098.1 DUF1329 domain-containing protein [Pandoraea cepalis]MDN4576754.1 DUF1329 domain-containing protein [Pandoraea cepalis]RRW92385.1 DUF1329 domain-containing protein [Pandoraea apista]RRX01851.1 DUF1329 domain-containing protein [Pandoraea apista]